MQNRKWRMPWTQPPIFYAKSELWIDSEKLYEVLYEMEV